MVMLERDEEAREVPLDRDISPFWLQRFWARCWCGREVELRVWQVMHERGWAGRRMTWRDLASKLRCTGCQRRAPKIRIPGWDGSIPPAGYIPRNEPSE